MSKFFSRIETNELWLNSDKVPSHLNSHEHVLAVIISIYLLTGILNACQNVSFVSACGILSFV